MSYYWFNKQEILQKAKERYSKEKAGRYRLKHKEATKEKSRERYKNLPQEEKDKIKEYQKKKFQELVQHESVKKIINFWFFLCIKKERKYTKI